MLRIEDRSKLSWIINGLVLFCPWQEYDPDDWPPKYIINGTNIIGVLASENMVSWCWSKHALAIIEKNMMNIKNYWCAGCMMIIMIGIVASLRRTPRRHLFCKLQTFHAAIEKSHDNEYFSFCLFPTFPSPCESIRANWAEILGISCNPWRDECGNIWVTFSEKSTNQCYALCFESTILLK